MSATAENIETHTLSHTHNQASDITQIISMSEINSDQCYVFCAIIIIMLNVDCYVKSSEKRNFI